MSDEVSQAVSQSKSVKLKEAKWDKNLINYPSNVSQEKHLEMQLHNLHITLTSVDLMTERLQCHPLDWNWSLQQINTMTTSTTLLIIQICYSVINYNNV